MADVFQPNMQVPPDVPRGLVRIKQERGHGPTRSRSPLRVKTEHSSVSKAPGRRRPRKRLACMECRAKKMRCTDAFPSRPSSPCTFCVAHGLECTNSSLSLPREGSLAQPPLRLSTAAINVPSLGPPSGEACAGALRSSKVPQGGGCCMKREPLGRCWVGAAGAPAFGSLSSIPYLMGPISTPLPSIKSVLGLWDAVPAALTDTPWSPLAPLDDVACAPVAAPPFSRPLPVSDSFRFSDLTLPSFHNLFPTSSALAPPSSCRSVFNFSIGFS